MGKESPAMPQAPDPYKLLQGQAASDKNAFDYQTATNRYNTVGPDSSQTWTNTPTFDQAGYDKALGAYNGSSSQGTWVPPSPGTPDSWGGVDMPMTPGRPASPGYWSGASGPTGDAPKRSDFEKSQYTLSTELSPEAQQLHDAQQGSDISKYGLAQTLMEKLGPTLGSSFDPSSVGGFSTDPGISGYLDKLGGLDPNGFSQDASDAVYANATRYLDPQVQQQQKALEARLSEQGFVPGTPGYQQAMQTFEDTNNRQYASARDSATTQGFNVGHMQFGDASSNLNSQIASMLQGKGFGNQAHAQGVADLLQSRQVPLSDLNSILSSLTGGSFNPSNAGSAAVPQGGVGALQNPDSIGLYNNQYNNQLDQYNAEVNSDNATTQSYASIAAALALAF